MSSHPVHYIPYSPLRRQIKESPDRFAAGALIGLALLIYADMDEWHHSSIFKRKTRLEMCWNTNSSFWAGRPENRSASLFA